MILNRFNKFKLEAYGETYELSRINAWLVAHPNGCGLNEIDIYIHAEGDIPEELLANHRLAIESESEYSTFFVYVDRMKFEVNQYSISKEDMRLEVIRSEVFC